jgi:hypothetical protein
MKHVAPALPVLVALSTFSGPQAWAQVAHTAIREDSAPASALGRADTMRASAIGASSLHFNPAGMSRVRQYALEASYSFLNRRDGHAFGATAVDSSTNDWLGMGLGYHYVISKVDGKDRDGHSIRAGTSTAYRNDDFTIAAGAGIRYVSLSDTEYFTIDAGVVLDIMNIVRLGAVGQNLIDTKAPAEAPRRIGFGAAVTIADFEVEFDLDLDLQNKPDDVLLTYAIGAQYMFEKMIVIRAGFLLDHENTHQRLSGGASYVSERLAVDAAVSGALRGGKDDIILGLGVRVFLP